MKKTHLLVPTVVQQCLARLLQHLMFYMSNSILMSLLPGQASMQHTLKEMVNYIEACFYRILHISVRVFMNLLNKTRKKIKCEAC